jgi:hypothetical protein
MRQASPDETGRSGRPREADAPGFTDAQLFMLMGSIADAFFDGHVTIMRCATDCTMPWRVHFGPQLGHPASEEIDAALQSMPGGSTVFDAFMAALATAHWTDWRRPRWRGDDRRPDTGEVSSS